MASWQKPMNGNYRVPAYHAPKQPIPQQPMILKRQASELKSMYPVTKWCAVYVASKGDSAASNWAADNLDVTKPIPSTNVCIAWSILVDDCRIFALFPCCVCAKYRFIFPWI